VCADEYCVVQQYDGSYAAYRNNDKCHVVFNDAPTSRGVLWFDAANRYNYYIYIFISPSSSKAETIILCRVYTRTHVARKHVSRSSRTSNLYPDTYNVDGHMSPDTSCSFGIHVVDCISAT